MMSGEEENLDELEDELIEVADDTAENVENDQDANQDDPLLDESAVLSRSTEALERDLTQANEKVQQNWDKLLRVQAEMDNLRRRTEKDVQNAHKFALEGFAKELLPVIDSLELGLNAASGENADITSLREGVELTLKQFSAALEKFKVVVVDPTGEPFNPEQHQAMAMQPSDEVAPDCVLQVFQKGYLLTDRLLRPAMVVVAQQSE